jgi:hypothetical protein
MEPTNLSSSSPDPQDDARLDAWMRQSPPPLPDDGFSQRVLAALPHPRSSASYASQRTLIVVAGGLLGAGVAWRQLATANDLSGTAVRIQNSVEEIRSAFVQSGTSLSEPTLSLAITVTVFSLLFAFRRNLGCR